MLSLGILLWPVALWLQTTAALEQPVVDLGYSTYEGTRLEGGVDEYLGMRFAAPPLGDLRFRAPANPQHTTGTQDATAVSVEGLICLNPYSCC